VGLRSSSWAIAAAMATFSVAVDSPIGGGEQFEQLGFFEHRTSLHLFPIVTPIDHPLPGIYGHGSAQSTIQLQISVFLR
jgi:hypothetical protein